jgi:tungstate transport system ATP-binding protein
MSAALPLQLRGVAWQAGGKRWLDGIDLTIDAGARTVVLGPNGAGKSLLLRLCHGLIEPRSGSLRWLGPAAGEAAGHQAMVFQRPVMLRRSAAANIGYALKIRGLDGPERHARTMAALARTGLSALAAHQARALSIGEQQRLALARAWAIEPEILWLDEPTASLDPAATFAVEEIIVAMHRTGCKIVMTTHDLAQARRLADEIVFLHRGRLLERQPADKFFSNPATAEAAAFVTGTLHW